MKDYKSLCCFRQIAEICYRKKTVLFDHR